MKIIKYYLNGIITGVTLGYALTHPFSIYPTLILVACAIQFIYDITRKQNN